MIFFIFTCYAISTLGSWVMTRPSIALRVVEKRGWFWGLLAFLYRPFGNFARSNTTIGNICAVPPGATLTEAQRAHEIVHATDCARLGWGVVWLGLPAFAILYLFLPLPAGLAWFRWEFERRAFQAGGTAPEEIVGLVCGRNYGWSWPKAWARKSLGLLPPPSGT